MTMSGCSIFGSRSAQAGIRRRRAPNLAEHATATRVNETIAYGWMMLIVTLVLGYTGFATTQDIAPIWRTGRARPYRDFEEDREPPPCSEPEPFELPDRPFNSNDTGSR